MPSAVIRSRLVLVAGARCCSGFRRQVRRSADCAVDVTAPCGLRTIGCRAGLLRTIAGPTRLGSPGSVGVAVAISATVPMSAVAKPVHGEDRRYGDNPDPVAC